MPEPTDVDQIARQIVDRLYSPDDMDDPAVEIPAAVAEIVEQLRLIWNAGYAAGERARWDPANLPTFDEQGRVKVVRYTHYRLEPKEPDA